MKTFLKVLKFLNKCLPYIISALGGATATAAISGCKCGSIISIVP